MTARSVAGACAMAMVATLALIGADRAATPMRAETIDGPYARLLAASTDLGPARVDTVQLTAALDRRTEPVRLSGWARANGMSVRWRGGDDWAVIEGAPTAVSAAFGLAVHDYRSRTGPRRDDVCLPAGLWASAELGAAEHARGSPARRGPRRSGRRTPPPEPSHGSAGIPGC